MTAEWLTARARVFFQMTPESELPEMDEVLRLLWQQAQEGSVTATAALARELRARAKAEHTAGEDELDRILAR
jgi:hypothetical protein